jgi:ribosomal protein S18 acetylase RimI-like enzyme
LRAPPLTDSILHRLERCATAFHVRRLELLRDLPGNHCGVEVRCFGDHVVATAASGVPDIDWMQHVAGLEPGDEPVVPEIAAWYRQNGIRPRFEIAPAADFAALAGALAGVGARQTGFIDALWTRAEAPPDRVATDVDIRVAEPDSDDAALFARVLLGGHGVPDDASTEHFAAVALWASEPGWRCYLASDAGRPLGAAALAVDDGIGYLASASTLPAGRRRGCQQALIRRRLRDASAAGCELTASLATPRTTSHRNLERAGLGVACTKVFWAVVST